MSRKDRASTAAKRRRRAWRRVLFVVFTSLARLAPAPGSRWLRAVGWVLARGAYYLRPAATRLDLDNLAVALRRGDATPSPAQRRRILLQSLANGVASSVQLLQLAHLDVAQVARMGEITGVEHLERALAAGKGVIGVGAHLGNFWSGAVMLADAGYPVSLVMREAKHVPPGYYTSVLERCGISPVPVDKRGGAARGMLAALRANCIVLIYLDQDAKKGGVEAAFLGKRVPLPEGAAVLARRTGAQLLPVISWDVAPRKLRVDLLPEVSLSNAADPTQALAEDMQRLADVIGEQIRQHPEQWLWRHRRWRERPNLPAAGESA